MFRGPAGKENSCMYCGKPGIGGMCPSCRQEAEKKVKYRTAKTGGEGALEEASRVWKHLCVGR